MNVVENLESKSVEELIAEVARILDEPEVGKETRDRLKQWRSQNKTGNYIKWKLEMAYEIAEIRGAKIVSVELDEEKPASISIAKVTYICTHGAERTCKLHAFSKGEGCMKGRGCAGRKEMATPIIIQAFATRDWSINDPMWEYEYGRAFIFFTCDKGHSHHITWNDFSQGVGCGKCGGQGYSIEEWTAIARKAFWERDEWVIPEWWIYSGNCGDYIPFTDRNGDDYFITWDAFKQGNGYNRFNGKDSYIEYMTNFVRKAFALAGRMIPYWWKYEAYYDPIPYYCDKCGKKHRQSWNNFASGHGCGKCHEQNRPKLAYIYSLETAVGWVTEKILNRLDISDASKAIAAAAVEIMPTSDLEAIRHLRKARNSTQDTDHIVPISYFDPNNPHQMAAANSIHNLRNIPATANSSRHNNLTVTEILRYFDNPKLREIYNAATQKPQRLPQKDLPLDEQGWEQWKEKRMMRGISKEDVKKFERWHPLWDDHEEHPLAA